jgi:hypothetical protein
MKLKNIILTQLAFIVVALLINLIDSAMGLTSGCMLAVVAGGQWNENLTIFRKNLEMKVGKEVWWKGKFSQFTAFIDYNLYKETGALGTRKDSPKLNQSIIHMVNDFKSSKRGVKIDVPLSRPLTGTGRIGTASLSGHGERKKLLYLKCAINMMRHAMETRDNEMSDQVLPDQITTELKNSAGELKDWFSRLMPFEFMFSLTMGFSRNLFDSSYGLGYSMKSHPNFYVQGDGQVLFKSSVGTHVAYTFDTGYETNIVTALATLADTESDHFSAQSIRNMVYYARANRIQPIDYQGIPVFPIFIHSAQARQLRQDEDWLRAQHDAAMRGDKNQIFTGLLEGYIYEGALIIIDDTIPGIRISTSDGWDATYSTTGASTGPQYFRSTFMDDPRDTAPLKPALLVGQGAILAAEGLPFKLTQEKTDHDQEIEDGARMIYGAVRADIIDEDNFLGNGANTFYDNNSSLIYVTYSPDTITI